MLRQSTRAFILALALALPFGACAGAAAHRPDRSCATEWRGDRGVFYAAGPACEQDREVVAGESAGGPRPKEGGDMTTVAERR